MYNCITSKAFKINISLVLLYDAEFFTLYDDSFDCVSREIYILKVNKEYII